MLKVSAWLKLVLWEATVQVFLGKGVLKICSIFTGEHPCRSVISINLPWKVSQSSQGKRNGAFSLGTLGAFQNSRNFEKTLKRLLLSIWKQLFTYFRITSIYVYGNNVEMLKVPIWLKLVLWEAATETAIEITLRHWCSPENLLHIFRKHFPKNTSGWLLLSFEGPLKTLSKRYFLSYKYCLPISLYCLTKHMARQEMICIVSKP